MTSTRSDSTTFSSEVVSQKTSLERKARITLDPVSNDSALSLAGQKCLFLDCCDRYGGSILNYNFEHFLVYGKQTERVSENYHFVYSSEAD